jgi:hypothetical protein
LTKTKQFIEAANGLVRALALSVTTANIGYLLKVRNDCAGGSPVVNVACAVSFVVEVGAFSNNININFISSTVYWISTFSCNSDVLSFLKVFRLKLLLFL